jgi:DNA invertase Pin-like site-specific DNA recombinase
MVRERTPRSLLHKLETTRIPLEELKAIRGLRNYLDLREAESLIKARRLGCSVSEIADALGMTRQGVYNKLRQAEIQRDRKIHGEAPIVIPELQPQPDE